MPMVRRDFQNVVFPLDLCDPRDVEVICGPVPAFVKRLIPVRFGLVPTVSSPASLKQAKVAHYLVETFGLSTLVRYLEEVSIAKRSQAPTPFPSIFDGY